MRWFYISALFLLALTVAQTCVGENAGHFTPPMNGTITSMWSL